MFDKRKESVESNHEPVQSTAEVHSFNSTSKVAATIGETIIIEGDISGKENLIINGTVNGTVDLSNHDLTIGQTGKVKADLLGKSVKIHGEVTGDIVGSEVVVVSKSGQVRGNITAPRVTLEDGANFKGSIDMDPVAGETVNKFSPKTKNNETDSASELRTVDAVRA